MDKSSDDNAAPRGSEISTRIRERLLQAKRRFNAKDGTWCDNPKLKIDRFEVRVHGDDIQVCVPPKKPPALSVLAKMMKTSPTGALEHQVLAPLST